MKFIQKSCAVLLIVGLAFTSSAGTLYWQVSDEEFSTAQLFVTGNGLNPDPTALTGAIRAQDFDRTTGTGTHTALTQTDISAYSSAGYSFYVELVNYNDRDNPKKGYTWGYGDLVSSGYVSTSGLDVADVTVAALSQNFAAAPEPSSGLLLLMGGAMLALRRRRQK